MSEDLLWTTERPKKDGFYWVRYPSRPKCEPEIVSVYDYGTQALTFDDDFPVWMRSKRFDNAEWQPVAPPTNSVTVKRWQT